MPLGVRSDLRRAAEIRRDRCGELIRRVEPGEVRAQFPTTPPVHPESFEGIFDDLDKIILPGLSLWQHPSFFGYFPLGVAYALRLQPK